MSAAATERVGRYQLLDPIGVGPSGTVSRAKVFGVAGFERQFAIKRFHPELTSTAALAQALSAAARAYGSLEHPRIARMSEFGVAQGTTFTAVEYVAGLDALRLIAEAKMAGATLAPGGSLALVSQAARAVGYAHGRGLTHLGLAPTNVMITADGDIKITDFGILAAALSPRPVETPRLANRIPYLAPEQLANEATSAATDVFALGVLAYELVTGHRTFRGETAQQIAQSVLAGPPIEPPLPRPIVRVLQRCLARSPFERFPDARALADALDAALRVAPVPGTRKDIGAQVKQTMERIAALHEGEMSGVLALNLGTGPTPRFGEASKPAERPPPSPVAVGRPDDFATNEFAKLQVGPEPRPTPTPRPTPPPRPTDLPGSTVPDLRPGAISTVTGVPPAPIPVPQGVAPPPTPTPPPATGTSTLLGVPSAKPPPLPGSRPGQPPPPPPPAARPEPPAAARPETSPATRPESPPSASSAPTRPAGLPRLPTPRPIPDAPGSPTAEAAPAISGAPARSATGAAPPSGPNEPAAPASQEGDGTKRPSRRITADLAVLEELPDSALKSEEMPATSAPPAPPGASAPSKGPPAPPPARGERPRSLIGFLPDEPSAFAGGTNVEIQLPPGFADAPEISDESAPEQALGPGGTSLALPPPPAIPHAPAEPPGGAPYGGGHVLPEPQAGAAHPSPGQAGYPSAAGLGRSGRDSDLAGSPGRGGADARSRQRLVLILGGVVAAAALAVGGWFVYGAITGDDDGGGGGSSSSGGGPISRGGNPDARGSAPDARGSAPAPPADAAIAVATVDAAPESPKPPSELSIVSTPPGAKVFLDGADAGVTPLKLPGTSDRHTVALLLTGHELYVAQVDGHGQFSIPLKQVAPNPDFAGIKVIQCKDKDRYYVFVDGKPSGQTCPTERINTTLGPHTVEVYDVVTEQRRKWQIDIKDGRISYRIRIDP